MDCREFLLRYSDYDDSLIPPHEAERFRAHMADCPSCARYDRVLRKGRMVARQLPRLDPADDFVPRLQRRLLHTASRRTGPSRGAGVWAGSSGPRLAAGLAAATIVMAVAAAFMLEGSVTAVPTVAGWQAPSAAGEPSTAPAVAQVAPVRRRVVTLPPVDRAEPRAWEAREVAPPRTASYSPLETGPPVYRVASSSPMQRTSGRALD